MKFLAKIFSNLPVRKDFLIGLLLVLAFFSSMAQVSMSGIVSALKQGDAKGLSQSFDKQIDLTFSDKTTTYSKKQAELIIQKFFSKVEPRNFTDMQTGGSKYNNTSYAIGNMLTSNGVYKVYMFFIKKDGVLILRELRFEK